MSAALALLQVHDQSVSFDTPYFMQPFKDLLLSEIGSQLLL